MQEVILNADDITKDWQRFTLYSTWHRKVWYTFIDVTANFLPSSLEGNNLLSQSGNSSCSFPTQHQLCETSDVSNKMNSA